MVLSDIDLKRALVGKHLIVQNLRGNAIQPASIDLHLGGDFIEFKSKQTIDIFDFEKGIEKVSVMDSYKIPSRSFVLATTDEYIELSDNLTAFIEGRSSIGRKGLFIHNAGFIDSGFKGTITLELFNASSRPIIIHKGMSICQMVVIKTSTPVQNPYNGKYQCQSTVTESKIYREVFREVK